MRLSIGTPVVLIGFGMAVFGMFLPLADTAGQGVAAHNSLIQKDITPILMVALIGGLAAAVAYEFYPVKRTAVAVMSFAAFAFIMFGFSAQDGMYDVSITQIPGDPSSRELVSMGNPSNWGTGPILVAVGTLLALVGGWIQERGQDRALTERDKELTEERENAPVPEARVALPKPLWRLLYGLVIVTLFVLPILAFQGGSDSSATYSFAPTFFMLIYAMGVYRLVSEFMKKTVVPLGAPNAPVSEVRAVAPRATQGGIDEQG